MAIEQLRAVRKQLTDRRQREAAGLVNAHDDERIARLNSIHTAISAIDAVISETEAAAPSVYENQGLRTL
jgi:hypothetical protein